MAEIILHPIHPDYCKECMYHGEEPETCTNTKYKENSYQIVCVLHYCPYKRKREKDDKRRTHN